MENKYSGVLDNRTEKEKSQDFRAEELVVFGVVAFPEREPVSYTVRNQSSSGSCVSQTVAKMLEVWKKKKGDDVVYSATPIYQSRSNKPLAGMSAVEALSHPMKNGGFLERDIPSQNMDDAQMDALTYTKRPTNDKPTNYLFYPHDFYSVGLTVQKYGAVMLWFKCSYQEWSQDIPSGNSTSEAVRHSVTCVDAIRHKGVDYLIIEDSWGTWLKKSDVPLKAGQRAITKEFFDAHNFLVSAFTTFEYNGGDKPHYTFSEAIWFGKKGEDVKRLQEILRYEKFFPSNVDITGYCGAVTLRALKEWQISHGITDFSLESNITKIRFGSKSIAEANKIYS